MRCDHQLMTEHLMDYVEDNLSPAVKRQLDQVVDQCEHCATTYRHALTMQQSAHQWQEQVVPEWHRTAYAVRPVQRNSGWLSWTALASSTLAILMVVFQVQFSVNQDGFNVAFGGASNQQVKQLVEEKLAEFKSQQDALLNAEIIAVQQKQDTNNKLTIAAVLEKVRDERRDDLTFLVTGIQSQRMQDQQKVNRQLANISDNQIENNQYINQLIQSANTSVGENQ